MVRLAPDPVFSPFEFFDSRGEFKGIAADYVVLLEKKLGIHFEPVQLKDWSEVLDQIKVGKVDMISAVMKTQERTEYLNFSEPYLRFPYVIIASDAEQKELDLRKLKGKSVAVVNKYAIHEFLEKGHPELNLVPVTDYSKGLRGVAFGKYDVFVANLASLSYFIDKEGITNLRVVGESGYFINLSIVVRKDMPELIPILNKGLNMVSEQERSAIFAKWINKLVPPSKQWWQLSREQIIVLLITLTVMVFLSILSWNRRLAREITVRQAVEKSLTVANRNLVKAKEAAESANRAKSIFLSNMNHELRTPLNAILGFSQLLGRDEQIPSEQRKSIVTINSSGRRLLSLINDVLEVSRVDTGETDINREPFDLPSSIASIEELIRIRTLAKELAFTVDCSDNLPTFVMGDMHHLRQVLLNLLGNAVKYTDSGEIHLNVTTLPEQKIRFEVTDTGPGIGEDEQELIFQAFYQTEDGITKGEGTGLGLTISRELVRLMGGKLTVASTPGEGSRFHFALLLPPTVPTPSPDIGNQIIGLATGQAAARILLVDDHPDNQQVAEQILKQIGCEVCIADNGVEAVELFQSWKPQLILMDMRMPVLDGYAATAQIRKLPGGDLVKIVALTASAFKEQRKGILDAGCDEVLHKPFQAHEIFDCLKKHLGLSYTYETAVESATFPVKQQLDMAKALVSSLPDQLRSNLEEAVTLLDVEVSYALIEDVRKVAPELADLLKLRVDEFDFDTLHEVFTDD
ncbi:MAG: transporter substrate-binding domain-containing protein [Sedimenticola sp.]